MAGLHKFSDWPLILDRFAAANTPHL